MYLCTDMSIFFCKKQLVMQVSANHLTVVGFRVWVTKIFSDLGS